MNTCTFEYQVACRLNELQDQIYKLGFVYKQELSGFQVIIQQIKHTLIIIRGYLVVDSAGNEVEIHFKLLSSFGVEITSNIDMTGLTIYLF